jgi:hypothetical protein
MPETQTSEQDEKKEAPNSGLLLTSEELREIRDRYAESVSDGGGTGRSDNNDQS